MDTIGKIDKSISMCDAGDNDWEDMILDALQSAKKDIFSLQENVSDLEEELQSAKDEITRLNNRGPDYQNETARSIERASNQRTMDENVRLRAKLTRLNAIRDELVKALEMAGNNITHVFLCDRVIKLPATPDTKCTCGQQAVADAIKNALAKAKETT